MEVKMDWQKFIKSTPYELYIDSAFVPSVSGRTFDMVNPANGEVFATAYEGGTEDCEKAIQAARKAFDEGPWPKMSPRERATLLRKAGDEFAKMKEEFAVAETLDCGKQYMSALYYEADMAADAFYYYAGLTRLVEGKVVPLGQDVLNIVEWYPYGVVGEILPWNGPMMMGCQKINAALAGGNTVVVKPSSQAALTMLMLPEVFERAGFPPGVVNVVTGPGALIGDYLVESKDVDMVSMTGGTETGKAIIKSSHSTAKPVALEMGGKSPNIVFADADLEQALRWARFAFTLSNGQVCVSGTRLLVEESIYEDFLADLKELCSTFVAGDGFNPEVNLTALCYKRHADAVFEYIQSGIDEGARLITGGKPYTEPHLQKGFFVPVTILADVTPDMKVFQEEIFGPVLCVTPFKDEADAIRLANMTDFGLAGGVHSRDIKKALRVARAMHGGQIYVNSYFSTGMIESPGTGWKESGIGVAGFKKYMISKTTFVNLAEGNAP
jgi:acyl-CoA reductase-like NAD-dependent aldehyde dehydrogenase